MKKTILFLSATVILFSCKKDTTNDFTQTDVTGTTTVKGNINKNIITPNGNGSWTTASRIPAAGINVSIKVNKNSLYPNSTAQGADIYTGTTNENGDYSIAVKSNATGVAAVISIDGFTSTLDTLINGTTKKGLYASYLGTTVNRTLFMGQSSQLDYGFTASNVTTNPNNIVAGTAVITGSVGVNFIKEVLTGTLITLSTTNVAVANHKVYLNFSNDPTTLTSKMYEVTTDANGVYSFNIATVASGTSGFNQNANVWVADYAATRDTIKVNNSIKTGRAGVFQQTNANQTGVYNNNIRNANNLNYGTFIPN